MTPAVPDCDLGQLAAAPLQWPALQPELKVIGVHDIGQLDSLLVANRAILHPFLAGRQANSDAHPVLDTGAEKARFMQDAAGLLHSLRWTPAPLVEVLGGLERRPYPTNGIGDLRDPHVFLETEQALALLRLWDDHTTQIAEKLTVSVMNDFIDEQRKVEAGAPDWDTWIIRTYAIYTQTSPHVRVADSPWWATVRRTVEERGAPEELRLVIDTLDALLRRDGPRLQRGLDALRASGSTLLSPGMMAIAGMIALELEHADPETRRKFAAERMKSVAEDESSAENFAYRILSSFAAR